MAAYLVENSAAESLVVISWCFMAAFNSLAVITLKGNQSRYPGGQRRADGFLACAHKGQWVVVTD